MDDAIDHDKKTANRERQARFRQRRKDDPNWRIKRNADQRRNYVRKHGVAAGKPKSVAEKKLLKEAFLRPDTRRRNELDRIYDVRKMQLREHYRKLLTNPFQAFAFCGICWFREIHGMKDPYKEMDIPYPFTWTKELLDAPTPLGWKFHPSDMLKNRHTVQVDWHPLK